MRMIVFPVTRSVGLRPATASSRVATLPMFVRSRPSRSRWTTSPSWARSASTTPGPDQACGALVNVSADDVEDQVDAAHVLQGVVLKVDELLHTEVERRLTVGSASAADDVGACLTCELRHHRPDCAGRAVREDA